MPEGQVEHKSVESILNDLKTAGEGTAVGGLLGNSISYSLSPALHNFSAQVLGLKFRYQLFDIPSDSRDDELSTLLTGLWRHGSPGINVTQPFKQRMASVVALLDSKQTKTVNSINTVFRGPSSFLGASTDGLGFVEALSHIQCPIERVTRLLIIGSGGATVAICEHLAAIGFRGEVIVLSRQAQPILCSQPDGTRTSIPALKLSAANLMSQVDALDENGLVIQASSAPHRGDDFSSLAGSLQHFKGSFIDLCYGKTSALLGICLGKGLRASDGLGMLIEQARASQILWWGRAAPYDEIQRHLAGLV